MRHACLPKTSISTFLFLVAVSFSGVAAALADDGPVIVQQPANQAVLQGAVARLTVAASGSGPFHYQWQCNGTNLAPYLMTTIAGGNTNGYRGDGGPATNALFRYPTGITFDSAGNLFIADAANGLVRKIDTNGIINWVVGGARMPSTETPIATNTFLNFPQGVVFDSSGNLYISEQVGNCIRKVDHAGIVTTIAGKLGPQGFSGDGGAATNAILNQPVGMAFDAAGALIFSDSGNARIRKIDTNGIITTIAGTGVTNYAGDGGFATNATLRQPSSIAIDGAGQIFIGDTRNNAVRKIDTNGIITTFAGTTNTSLGGGSFFWGEGVTATNAKLFNPAFLAFDPAGNLFIADEYNYRVRKVDTNSIITTVVGSGVADFSGDGGAATNAALYLPVGLAFDKSGNLFFSQYDHRLREAVTTDSPVLMLPRIDSSQQGNYSVIVTSPYGSITSSVASLTMLLPPAINVQPSNLVAVAGTDVSIVVGASGDQPLTYNWYFGNSLAQSGGNNTLTITNVGTNNAGSYNVVVQNPYGSITSSVATITVVLPPSILVQPASATVLAGASTSFDVLATGTGPLTYLWYGQGTNLLQVGASSLLSITNATSNFAGAYRVVVTNAYGAVTSVVATLSVVFAPSINIQPAGQTILAGNDANLNVTASGTAPMSYLWFRGVSNLVQSGNNASLTLHNVTGNDSGNYDVVVTNQFGSVTSSVAVVSVVTPPSLTVAPQSQTVLGGSNATFSATAVGTGPLGYNFYFNGALVQSSLTSTLNLANVGVANQGDYLLVVTNAYGSCTSTVATLSVVFPPSIVGQPASQTVIVEGNATFSIACSGTGPLTYNWYKGGTNLVQSGASSALALQNVTATDSGSYTVVVTNPYGTSTSSIVSLTIVFPPSIITQPYNVVGLAATSTNLDVVTTGTSPVIYNWFLGTNLLQSSTVSKLVLNTLTTNDSGDYHVVITNSYGAATSQVATLSVVFAPSINIQPTGQTILKGNDVNLSVTAFGTEPMSYLWFRGPSNLVQSGSDASFTLHNVTASDSGNYDVVVTNLFGSITSSVAVVSVVTPPSLTVAPQSQTILGGSNATFSAVAVGTAPLVYNYYFNGTLLQSALMNTLSLTNVGAPNQGEYVLVVTNAYGSCTSAVAFLGVAYPPSIAWISSNQTVAASADVSFSATVSGSSPIALNWYGNGALLQSGTTSELLLRNVNNNSSGSYQIIATNAYGSVTSSVVTLRVIEPPSFVAQPVPVSVNMGATAGFSVLANGTAPLSYQWFCNGTNLLGATSDTCVITNCQTGSAGNYSVVVSNFAGAIVSSNAQLIVNLPPVVTKQPIGLTNTAGTTVSFDVSVSGTQPMSFQWSKGAKLLVDGGNISGANAAHLVLTNVSAADSGVYSVAVTNIAGSAGSQGVDLLVLDPPSIVQQPQSRTVEFRSSAVLSVSANGSSVLHYQWYSGQSPDVSVPISDATNSAYTLSALTNSTSYWVRVANAAGSIDSDAAVLTVVDTTPPVIVCPADISAESTNGSDAIVTFAPSATDLVDAAPMVTATPPSGSRFPLGTTLVHVVAKDYAGNQSACSFNVTVMLGRPYILVPPQSTNVFIREDAVMSVRAVGAAPLAYQWFKDGIALKGATNSVLKFASVLTNNLGNYTVLVRNSLATLTSQPASLTVTTNFSVMPTVAGSYSGLFLADEVTHQNSGLFSIVVLTNSTLTGSLTVDGDQCGFSGRVNPQAGSIVVVPRGAVGKLDLLLNLQFDGSNKVSGLITGPTWTSTVQGNRAFFNATNLARAYATNYTAAILGVPDSSSGPIGSGPVTMRITTNGLGVLSGTLADGQAISQSMAISKDGTWPLYVPLYRVSHAFTNLLVTNRLVVSSKVAPSGCIIGWVGITNALLSGRLFWVNPGWTNVIDARGFTNQVDFIGSCYSAPRVGVRALAAMTNAVVTLEGGNLLTSISYSVSIATNNVVKVLSANPNRFALTLVPASGLFQATFTNPGVTNRLTTARGVLLQGQQAGVGYFLGTNAVGSIVIQ